MTLPNYFLADLPPEADILTMFVHVPGRKLLVAATSGHGFITSEDDALAHRRSTCRRSAFCAWSRFSASSNTTD